MATLVAVSMVFGQSRPAKDPDSPFMAWVHGAWQTVQDEGRPMAQRIVRQWPKRFQDIKSTVATMTKKFHDVVDSADLPHKRDLLVELWRVRKSLDLLTLIQPETLKSLTGLDTSGLNSLESQTTAMCKTLTAKLHGHS